MKTPRSCLHASDELLVGERCAPPGGLHFFLVAHMNLELLRTFLEVNHARHFGRAAEAL